MGKVKNEHKEPKPKKTVADILNDMAQAYVQFPLAIFGDDDKFIATASDDYLHNYDIHKDDIIIFHRQDHADYGQIVCALVGAELVIRHYVLDEEKEMPYLKSANPSVQDVYDFNIVGTIAWILRRYANIGNIVCGNLTPGRLTD